MIKHIITILLSCAFLTGQAQELKSIEPSLNDYLLLLKAQGYMVYSFDTKDFNGAQAEPVVMEYVKGEEPKDVLGFSFSMNFGEKLVIGFAPSGNDSTAIYTFNFSEGRGFNGRLNLRAIYAPEEPTKSRYSYESGLLISSRRSRKENSSRSSCMAPIGMNPRLASAASAVRVSSSPTSLRTS